MISSAWDGDIVRWEFSGRDEGTGSVEASAAPSKRAGRIRRRNLLYL